MLFNFDDMEETIIHNFNGGKNDTKAKMFIDENVKILYGTMEPGSSIGLHTHEKNSESVYCISGEATVTMDGKTEILKPGMCHYCPMGHTHGMENKGDEDLVIFAVVPNHEK